MLNNMSAKIILRHSRRRERQLRAWLYSSPAALKWRSTEGVSLNLRRPRHVSDWVGPGVQLQSCSPHSPSMRSMRSRLTSPPCPLLPAHSPAVTRAAGIGRCAAARHASKLFSCNRTRERGRVTRCSMLVHCRGQSAGELRVPGLPARNVDVCMHLIRHRTRYPRRAGFSRLARRHL
jgi:hypothetical protein